MLGCPLFFWQEITMESNTTSTQQKFEYAIDRMNSMQDKCNALTSASIGMSDLANLIEKQARVIETINVDLKKAGIDLLPDNVDALYARVDELRSYETILSESADDASDIVLEQEQLADELEARLEDIE